MRWHYQTSFAKQYTRGDQHGDRILRTETRANDTRHFSVRRRLESLPLLHDKLMGTNERCERSLSARCGCRRTRCCSARCITRAWAGSRVRPDAAGFPSTANLLAAFGRWTEVHIALPHFGDESGPGDCETHTGVDLLAKLGERSRQPEPVLHSMSIVTCA